MNKYKGVVLYCVKQPGLRRMLKDRDVSTDQDHEIFQF